MTLAEVSYEHRGRIMRLANTQHILIGEHFLKLTKKMNDLERYRFFERCSEGWFDYYAINHHIHLTEKEKKAIRGAVVMYYTIENFKKECDILARAVSIATIAINEAYSR